MPSQNKPSTNCIVIKKGLVTRVDELCIADNLFLKREIRREKDVSEYDKRFTRIDRGPSRNLSTQLFNMELERVLTDFPKPIAMQYKILLEMDAATEYAVHNLDHFKDYEVKII